MKTQTQPAKAQYGPAALTRRHHPRSEPETLGDARKAQGETAPAAYSVPPPMAPGFADLGNPPTSGRPSLRPSQRVSSAEEEDPLVEGWKMFRDGKWRDIAQFVTAFNARFGVRRYPTNFATQFVLPWVRDLHVSPDDVARVKRLLRWRRLQATAPAFATPPAPAA